jgi:hypothetical protein
MIQWKLLPPNGMVRVCVCVCVAVAVADVELSVLGLSGLSGWKGWKGWKVYFLFVTVVIHSSFFETRFETPGLEIRGTV